MTGQQQQGFISHPQLLVVSSRGQRGTRSFSNHGREESGNCCKSSEVILPVCSKDDCLRHQTRATPHSHSEACCPYTLFLHVLPYRWRGHRAICITSLYSFLQERSSVGKLKTKDQRPCEEVHKNVCILYWPTKQGSLSGLCHVQEEHCLHRGNSNFFSLITYITNK